MDECRTTPPALYQAGRVQVRCLLHSSRNEVLAPGSPAGSVSSVATGGAAGSAGSAEAGGDE
jgi:hypothetical protein